MRVKNDSPVTWAPTPESGFALGNHWLTPTGELLVWADGRTPLDKPVPPFGRMVLYLQVRAPSVRGEYLLEIDLVEEGVTWFQEKDSMPAIVRVTVSGQKKRASYVGGEPIRYIVSDSVCNLLERLTLLAEAQRAVRTLRRMKSGLFQMSLSAKR